LGQPPRAAQYLCAAPYLCCGASNTFSQGSIDWLDQGSGYNLEF